MSVSVKRSWFLLVLSLTLAPSFPAFGHAVPDPGDQPKRETLPMTLFDRQGKTHQLTVEVARTDSEKKKGLSSRKDIPDERGMVFLFDPPETVTMWMRGTSVPLDMVFIGPDSRITSMVENTVPFSEALIEGRGKSRAVLEVKAGTMQKMGIAVGDKIVSKALTAALSSSDLTR